MHALLLRLTAWLSQKVVVAGLIGVLGVAALAMWLFIKDEVGNEQRRAERLAQLEVRREMLGVEVERLGAWVEEMRGEAERQQARVEQAVRAIERIREGWRFWDRWFGDNEARLKEEERLVQLERLQREAVAREAESARLAAEAEAERAAREAERAEAEAEWAALQEQETGAGYYVREAWRRAKWWVMVALLSYFFGPTVMKVLLYYGLAPLVSLGRPIHFRREVKAGEEEGSIPGVGESRVSVVAAVWPGEVLRVKEKFLQASDETLSRKTRFVLDWRIPFTSVACGLIELVEMANGRAGEGLKVTFSNNDDPHLELAMVELPEGASLVLRPSFLAGVITAQDRPLQIRRRWSFARWQAWVTLQFRYFEFAGPCRLLVVGSRGVRSETLGEGLQDAAKGRRANQEATIGFTPGLECQPVRAETFWGYYRDMNPLFDDLFRGRGMFLLQETASAAGGRRGGGFWATLWNGILKVFGL